MSSFFRVSLALVALAGCLITPLIIRAHSVSTGILLLEAYKSDGTLLNTADFYSDTNYIASSHWSIGQNHGVFPLGTPPATKQSGSDPYPMILNGCEYVALTVPSNQALYFTSLWRVDAIGTVFLRADNSGRGFLVARDQTHVLELPYEFVLSEFYTLNLILSDPAHSDVAFSSALQNALLQASESVQAATRADSRILRARASYQALSIIMPLKERLVMEINDASITKIGYRPDFALNYEGFGDWTSPAYEGNYKRARLAGFNSVYTTCDWTRISPARGVYDFSAMDAQIDRAISLGFNVHLGVNISVENPQMPQWAVGLSFEELKSLYYTNARLAIDRYKEKIALFYAIGEPELNTHGYSMDQIAELVRQSFNGARDAAPSKPFGIYLSAAAYVGYQMNHGVNLFSSWDLVKCLSQKDIKFDFIGLEMQYATVFAPLDMQRIQEFLVDLHNLAGVPIYVGETGYSSKSEDYGIPASYYWREGLTQRAQAEWADNFLRICYGNTFIKGLYWVHLADDIGDGTAVLSSLVGSSPIRRDFAEKMAYFAFQRFMDGRNPGLPCRVPEGGAAISSTPGGDGEMRVGFATIAAHPDTAPYATAVLALKENGITVMETGVPASPPTTSARIFIDFRSAAAAVPGRDHAGTIDINTGIAIVNNNQVEAIASYTLRDVRGVVIAEGRGKVDAQSHFALFIDQLAKIAPDFFLPAGFSGSTQFGSLEISSAQPLSILALRQVTNQRRDVLFTTTPVADLTQLIVNTPVYFPQFADGGGFTTTVVLLNTSSAIESGRIQVLDDDGFPFIVNEAGGPPNSLFRYSIAPGGAFRFQSAGSAPSTKAGWVQVTPDSGTSTPVGAGLFAYNPGNVLLTESGVPAAGATTHGRIYVDLTGRHNTGLAIANVGRVRAAIDIRVFQIDGVTGIGTGSGSLELAGGGHRARFADQVIAGLPPGFTGVLEISSQTPFAALTLRSLYNERDEFLTTAFPVADANHIAPAPIVFPQIVDRGGYLTQIILLSAGGASNTSLRFYGNTGMPLALER